MTHDGRDMATPGRWRLRPGARRQSRVTTVAPVDETTVDETAAYERLLANAERALEKAENRLLRAVDAIDTRVGRTRERHLWAGLTQEQMLAAFADQLLEIRTVLSGKAK